MIVLSRTESQVSPKISRLGRRRHIYREFSSSGSRRTRRQPGSLAPRGGDGMSASQTWFSMTIAGEWRQSRGQYGIDERKLVLKAKEDMVRLIYPADPTDLVGPPASTVARSRSPEGRPVENKVTARLLCLYPPVLAVRLGLDRRPRAAMNRDFVPRRSTVTERGTAIFGPAWEFPANGVWRRLPPCFAERGI